MVTYTTVLPLLLRPVTATNSGCVHKPVLAAASLTVARTSATVVVVVVLLLLLEAVVASSLLVELRPAPTAAVVREESPAKGPGTNVTAGGAMSLSAGMLAVSCNVTSWNGRDVSTYLQIQSMRWLTTNTPTAAQHPRG